jgi:hypothetical protein
LKSIPGLLKILRIRAQKGGCTEGVGKEGGRVDKEQRQNVGKLGTKKSKEGHTLLCWCRTWLQSLLLADIGKAFTCFTEREKNEELIFVIELAGGGEPNSHDSKKAGLPCLFLMAKDACIHRGIV